MLVARDLLASESPTIVLVTSERHVALQQRLRAELLSLDYRVEEVEQPPIGTSLEEISKDREAIAALRVTPGGEAVEIWVTSREPDAGKTREFVPISRRRGLDVNAIAAVEVLRARLVKLGHAPELESAPERPASPAPAPSQPPESSRVFWLALGAGAAYSPGGLGANPVLLGGIRVAPAEWVSTAVFSAWQPMARTVLEAEGQADLRASIIGVGVDFPIRGDRFETLVGVGGALVVVDMTGFAEAPFRGVSDSVFSPAPVFCAAFVWKSSELVGLRADLLGGVSMPRAAVRFGGRETHYWGRPFGVLALGVELGLF
jgi:hypothetical protein